MGKVGSTTISYSLFMAGFYTLDIHTLFSPQVTKPTIAPVGKDGKRPPHHVIRSRRAGNFLKEAEGPIEIITAVREPLGRNLSAFFQNVKKADLAGKSIAEVIAFYKESYPHSIPLEWFDNELRRGTGVDLLTKPFDVERGWSIYEEGRFRFLTIRLDGPAEAMGDGLEAFLGEPLHIASQNDSRGKFYADIYAKVKDRISFDQEDIQKMYSSRYAKAFWSPQEIRDLRMRWSGAKPSDR